MFTAACDKQRIARVGPMHDRISQRRTAALALRLAVPCLMLAGCATSSVDFFADSGKYQYHTCDQLAAAAKSQGTRERELRELMDKAGQSAGGAVVSVLAYQADYVAVSEELRVIDATARAKNCQSSATWQSNGAIR